MKPSKCGVWNAECERKKRKTFITLLNNPDNIRISQKLFNRINNRDIPME